MLSTPHCFFFLVQPHYPLQIPLNNFLAILLNTLFHFYSSLLFLLPFTGLPGAFKTQKTMVERIKAAIWTSCKQTILIITQNHFFYPYCDSCYTLHFYSPQKIVLRRVFQEYLNHYNFSIVLCSQIKVTKLFCNVAKIYQSTSISLCSLYTTTVFSYNYVSAVLNILLTIWCISGLILQRGEVFSFCFVKRWHGAWYTLSFMKS